MAYYLTIPAELRVPQDGVEKYLLRKAFDGSGLLPKDVLWRPKVKFADGMSDPKRTWTEVVSEYAETQVRHCITL